MVKNMIIRPRWDLWRSFSFYFSRMLKKVLTVLHRYNLQLYYNKLSTRLMKKYNYILLNKREGHKVLKN